MSFNLNKNIIWLHKISNTWCNFEREPLTEKTPGFHK